MMPIVDTFETGLKVLLKSMLVVDEICFQQVELYIVDSLMGSDGIEHEK